MASLSMKSVILAAWSWSREGQIHSEHVSITLTSLFVVISLLMWYAWMKKTAVKYPLPPGPRGLPLVGNLPFIDQDVYRYFAKMTQMYGPIFKLKMGSKLYVVVGSTSYAKEVLKDCDTIFANRDTPSAIVTLSYGGAGLIWTMYGSHWRMLRMICTQHILNKASLDALYILRRRQLRRTVKFLYSKIGSPVDIADQMFFTSLNTITSMLWGGTVKDDEMSSAGKEFQQATIEAIALMGEPNISDLFPLLARFDIQGIARRAQTLFLWFNRILDSIINERVKFNQAGEKNENSDFLDILLELKDRGDSKIPVTIANIKALFLDLVVAATDTTATTVEWAMAEIINHPEIMKRIQEELVTVVGENGMVEESHIHQLTYLEAVIKETFRFHSVVPFLVPRCPSESCIIGGYIIPKGTQILVNARALQSDPKVWENPSEFQPERFLKSTIKWDYSGNNFSFLPLGSGRRMCAGSSLVERTVPYALASLLHSFNWRLPEGVALDFSDKMTLTLKKMTPLIAIPTPRLLNPELYL